MQTLKFRVTIWALLALLSFVAASQPEVADSIVVREHLVARQDEEPTASEEPPSEPTDTEEPSQTQDEGSEEPTPTQDEESEDPTPTDDEEDPDDSEDSEETGGTSSRRPTPTRIPPNAPAGGIEVVTPISMRSQPTYIKIGEIATFVWNYTSLIVTPTAVDVVAYRRNRELYYTIAGNQSVQETGSVIWNTAEYVNNEQPLEEDTYTFMVYDVASGPTAMASPGHLGVNGQYTFGLYRPQTYTSNADGWTCPSCSAAPPSIERQALLFAVGTAVVTICSFTWFAAGFGLFA